MSKLTNLYKQPDLLQRKEKTKPNTTLAKCSAPLIYIFPQYYISLPGLSKGWRDPREVFVPNRTSLEFEKVSQQLKNTFSIIFITTSIYILSPCIYINTHHIAWLPINIAILLQGMRTAELQRQLCNTRTPANQLTDMNDTIFGTCCENNHNLVLNTNYNCI